MCIFYTLLLLLKFIFCSHSLQVGVTTLPYWSGSTMRISDAHRMRDSSVPASSWMNHPPEQEIVIQGQPEEATVGRLNPNHSNIYCFWYCYMYILGTQNLLNQSHMVASRVITGSDFKVCLALEFLACIANPWKLVDVFFLC